LKLNSYLFFWTIILQEISTAKTGESSVAERSTNGRRGQAASIAQRCNTWASQTRAIWGYQQLSCDAKKVYSSSRAHQRLEHTVKNNSR